MHGVPGFLRLALTIGMALAEGAIDWSAQLDALGGGDRAALARIRRLVTVQLIAMRAYQARESWDDLAQEILIRVWRSHRDGRIREYAALPAFVRTLTRNAFLDVVRKRAPHPESEPGVIERTATSDPVGPDVGTQLALRKAVEHLSPRHREVVERLYLQGLSYDETAAELGRPRGTINRLQREAIQQLRALLLEAGEAAI